MAREWVSTLDRGRDTYLGRGNLYLLWPGGDTYLGWVGGGVPPLDRREEYLHWPGGGRGTYLAWGKGYLQDGCSLILTWPGEGRGGIPTLDREVPTLAGINASPPPGGDKLTN